MAKPKLATCSLAGCFGCHMSMLDIDERILELMELIEFDKSPLDDKKAFDSTVDIGLIEGGCANERNVEDLRRFRDSCRTLVSVGACAISGGVPAMRNQMGLRECLDEAYVNGRMIDAGSKIPDDDDLPLLLNRVYPAHEFVKIDHFLPGCPPSADAIWEALTDLLAGKAPTLIGSLLKYD